MRYNGVEYVFQTILLLCYTAIIGALVVLGLFIEYQSVLLSSSEPTADFG